MELPNTNAHTHEDACSHTPKKNKNRKSLKEKGGTKKLEGVREEGKKI